MARLLANGRPQHIPSQTDTVVRFVQEHVAVFLRLCELVKRGATMATTRNGVAQGGSWWCLFGAQRALLVFV